MKEQIVGYLNGLYSFTEAAKISGESEYHFRLAFDRYIVNLENNELIAADPVEYRKSQDNERFHLLKNKSNAYILDLIKKELREEREKKNKQQPGIDAEKFFALKLTNPWISKTK